MLLILLRGIYAVSPSLWASSSPISQILHLFTEEVCLHPSLPRISDDARTPRKPKRVQISRT